MQLIAGRYEPLEVVASGGMATVWRARDHRLDRLVALKRPHQGLAGETAGARMDREARAAAALSHPNLVTIYDYGLDRDGPYLVMELLDGPTLDEIPDDIDAGGAVEIGAQLADGLAAIHGAGIVHRDVKPANVIMSDHGPQLTDFGIATDPALVGDITDPGHVVATPSYAAPEVLRGEEPTPGSDVYSLAVVIEELTRAAKDAPDPHLELVLESAKSFAPADRPSAAEFAEALRGVTPTVSRPAARGGSTLVLETTPFGGDGEDDTGESGRRFSWWTGGLLAAIVAVGGLVALGLAFASDDADANSPGSVAPVDSTTTTLLTTTTLVVDTTVSPETDELELARQELETLLLEPPRSDLNRADVEDLLEKIDEAVRLAREGELKEAEKKLSEVGKRIDEKLGEESGDEAFQLLSQIADLMGVDFDVREDRDDDD